MDLTIKYQPKSFEEVILPPELRKKLSTCFCEKLPFPFLFSGQSGVGKTLVAQLVRKEKYFLSCLNGCSELEMKHLESSISAVSLSGERRLVILDDVDHMSPNSQLHLKFILDRFMVNNDFLLTAIEPFRLKETIRSRVQVIDFEYVKSNEFTKSIFEWLNKICQKEGFEAIDPVEIMRVIATSYPDMRKMLRTIQSNFML